MISTQTRLRLEEGKQSDNDHNLILISKDYGWPPNSALLDSKTQRLIFDHNTYQQHSLEWKGFRLELGQIFWTKLFLTKNADSVTLKRFPNLCWFRRIVSVEKNS